MPDSAAGTQFTVLGPTQTVDDAALGAFYAYPEQLERWWVRANMIASLDGGATTGGKSGALGGAGDRALFSLMREAADVILVGAATVRVENYSGAQLAPSARQTRQQRGQAEVPPIAVLTRSGRLDHDAKIFQRTEVAPLILTSSRAVDDTRGRLGGLAEVIDASGADPDSVDPAAARPRCAGRSSRRGRAGRCG